MYVLTNTHAQPEGRSIQIIAYSRGPVTAAHCIDTPDELGKPIEINTFKTLALALAWGIKTLDKELKEPT